MNLNKKLLWSAGALLPLVVAPVAVVASCATTVSPAGAIAEVLHQDGKVAFKANAGTYSEAQVAAFQSQPSSFTNELEFNVTDNDKEQFKFEVVEVSPVNENGNDYLKIKVKVSDKTNTSDVATSSDIKLAYTKQAASEKVQAAIKTVNEAYDNKTFKVIDNLTLSAAHLKFMAGFNQSENSANNVDLTQINSDQAQTLLKKVFTGFRENDSDVKLSVASFKIDQSTKADAMAKLTLQLKYSDASGDQPTSALTKEFQFDIKYSDEIKAAAVIQVWDLIMELKWLTYTKVDGYLEADYTAENFVKPEYTNYEALKNQFFLSDGWTFELPTSDFKKEKTDSDANMIVKFKIKVTKGSDNATSKEYTMAKHPIKKQN